MAKPSTRPKTPARTSSGTMRWRRVRPATSTMARLMPQTTIMPAAAEVDGATEVSSSPSPKTAAPKRQPGREPAPTDEEDGQRATEHAAQAGGRRQVAGPRAADVEDLDGQQHEQDVEGADHHVAGAEHHHQQPLVGVAADLADALEERWLGGVDEAGRAAYDAAPMSPIGRALARSGASRVHDRRVGAMRPKAIGKDGGDGHQDRADDEDLARLTGDQQEASQERADEDAEAIDDGRDGVAGGDLLGGVGIRGDERGLEGPRDGQAAGVGDRDEVDERGRQPDQHRHADRERRQREGGVARDQEAVPPVAVAEAVDERREEGGRHELAEGDQPDRGRPAGIVGIDQQRDPGAVLEDREAEVRQRHPAQVRVPQHRHERTQRGAETAGGHA